MDDDLFMLIIGAFIAGVVAIVVIASYNGSIAAYEVEKGEFAACINTGGSWISSPRMCLKGGVL